MLLFRSEEHVDQWCATRGQQRRPLVTLEQLWQLALAWYESRMTAEARRPMGDEVKAIFAGLGLVGEFWEV
jgi:hypothetical protein